MDKNNKTPYKTTSKDYLEERPSSEERLINPKDTLEDVKHSKEEEPTEKTQVKMKDKIKRKDYCGKIE